MAMPGIKWEDNPNRKERRRRWKSINLSTNDPKTRGAFGASPADTERAVKRRAKQYHSS